MSPTKIDNGCLICGTKNNKNVFKSEAFDLVKCHRCGNTWLISYKRQQYEESYYIEREVWYKNYKKNYNENEHPVPRYRSIIADMKQLGYSSGKLLEVGCSKGLFLHLAAKTGYSVCGTDISEYATRYAKDNFGLTVYCSDLANAGFSNNSFDIVVMIDVAEHLEYPKEILKECYRVLKPGGLLVLDTPNEDSLINKISIFLYNISCSKIKFFVQSNHDIEHLVYFSPSGMNKFLDSLSFKVLKIKLFNINPEARGLNKIITLAAKLVFLTADILKMQNKMAVFARKKREL